MKTLYRTILATSFLFLFLACEEEGDISSHLLGVWIKDFPIENTNQVSRLEYQFKSDNTVEIANKVIDASSHQLLGYRYISEGSYTVVEEQLTLLNLQQYNNDDTKGYYDDADALIPANIEEESVVNISFNRKKDKLTFEYTSCPPNAICLGSQTFYRE